METFDRDFIYLVCFSFAGEDRDYVEEVAKELKLLGITVFYDKFEQVNLWGKDLYTYLDSIYRNHAKYCVMFISTHYKKKLWTNHERKSAQARAFTENSEYILPARFDDTEIPGILPTTGYIELKNLSPKEFALLIEKKIQNDKYIIPHRRVDNKLHDFFNKNETSILKFMPFKDLWGFYGTQPKKLKSFLFIVKTEKGRLNTSIRHESFSEGLLAVQGVNGKYGFIDVNGNTVIPCQFDFASSMFQSMAKVHINNKWGMIDNEGNKIIPLEYEYIDQVFWDSTISVYKDDTWELFDFSMNTILTKKISKNEVHFYREMLQSLRRFEIPAKRITTDFLNEFPGDKYLKHKFYPFEKSDLKGIINYLNNKKYKGKLDNNEGSSHLSTFSKDDHWGIGVYDSNYDINVVFDCVFEQINDYGNDRCLVRFDGFAKNEWAIIDTEGNILVKLSV